MDAYADLLIAKTAAPLNAGIAEMPDISDVLYGYQKECVEFGIDGGRWGLFLDTGLGKTLCEFEWSTHAADASNGYALILTPLAVAAQMRREAERFGYQARVIREQSEARPGINICNYDRLHLIDPGAFGSVCLDESAILKDMTGKMSRALRGAFADHRWRMIASAVPAPNDRTEIGQSAEFLGIMPATEMLMRWFIADFGKTGAYRLKQHGEAAFWDWVASWSRMAGHPRELGYDDAGFDLPELRIIRHQVEGAVRMDGSLFGGPVSATGIHDLKRQTSEARSAAVARVVEEEIDEPWVLWVDTDYEADALCSALRRICPSRVLDVRGSMPTRTKEETLERFAASGEPLWLVTKPSIAGWGLNWQHCARMAFCGRSYSYEQWYQAIRREWRYGQNREVLVHLAVAEGEDLIGRVLERKANDHRRMQEQMAAAMSRQVNRRTTEKVIAPYEPIASAVAPEWLGGAPVACMAAEIGERFALFNGDCVSVMRQLPDASIDLSVYSPPFAGIYIYSDSVADMGNCADDDEFLRQYRWAAEEQYRIVRPGRLAVVHCKDLRNLQSVTGRSGLRDFPGKLIEVHQSCGWEFHTRITIWRCPVKQQATSKGSRLNYKDLLKDSSLSMMGLPEYLLIFRRWPEGEAQVALMRPVQQTKEGFALEQWQKWASPVWGWPAADDSLDETDVLGSEKDAGDEKHICPLPLDITRRVVGMWSNPGDIVLSPFAGIGSEGKVALSEGRRFVGIELKAGYFKQAAEHCSGVDRQRTMFDETIPSSVVV